MKKYITLICLTVMLRVWWSNIPESFWMKDKKAGNGIFMYLCAGTGNGPTWTVRLDNGGFETIFANSVYKSKWVEVSAEK